MKKKLSYIISVPLIIYSLLLIPDKSINEVNVANQSPFIWNKDSLWYSLENKFKLIKKTGCENNSMIVTKKLNELKDLVKTVETDVFLSNDLLLDSLLHTIFGTTTFTAACPDSAQSFITILSKIRNIVKGKSIIWDHNSIQARNALYKLLYGSRAALEEIILQSDTLNLPSLINLNEEPSSTPSTTFMGVRIHSGDILVSRGGAPTSALISRGSDYPGNFSHIALLFVDPKTNIPSIIEAHIEIGVAISTLEDYIKDKKLRMMILRLRSDLPQIIADPMIPHKAAKASLKRALAYHIPYDFQMDDKNYDKLFCSEVASSVYRELGINLWTSRSTISSEGTAKLLAGFGVTHFETQEPSDLEYDPQLKIVAEWFERETLYQDHIDNAAVDAILEWTELKNEITFEWYMLPAARLVKFYSLFLNQFEEAGPIPEGMSATSALRHESFNDLHKKIKSHVIERASDYSSSNHYNPPYWRLLEFAREYF